MNLIEIKNLSFEVEGIKILENINLQVKEKEFLGIIGPNGGGKTTLLKIMLGLIKPTSGEVFVNGKKNFVGNKTISYVPQFSNFEINYPISVKNVVMMSRLGKEKLFKKVNVFDHEQVDKALESVNLTDYKDRLITDLSGGEKQRVLIARALASEPKVLLLDEPTASVDSFVGQNFYTLLKNLNKTKTIILVSHDIGAVSQYVKKIACLNKNLVYHDAKEISPEMLEKTYHCPVDLIAHGVAHRVLDKH